MCPASAGRACDHLLDEVCGLSLMERNSLEGPFGQNCRFKRCCDEWWLRAAMLKELSCG